MYDVNFLETANYSMKGLMDEWRKQLDFVIVVINFVKKDEHVIFKGIQMDDSSLFSGLPKYLGSY